MMKTSETRIGFMGFGHMAQILFQGIDRARIVPRSHISFIRRDAAKMKQNEQKFGITSTSLKTLVQESDLIFLGMRPQQAEEALRQLSLVGGLAGKQFISILAGTKIEALQKHLGPEAQVLRAMPNLASQVGEGMTVLTYGPRCTPDFKSLGNLLFASLGEIAEVPESMMDIACGMAGSGPGFVFRLVDAMARAGEKQGMPYPQALKIAAQAFTGAARLISKGALPADLLLQIATPNGTTQAGLDVMTQLQVDKHFQSAIEAAAKRSKELSESR
ncbi:MAG: pyrroline-5-carboxylate reductase [Verrucomicrobiota bacterium]|nr:pyrroline-5-carboxylate reductase [Verrucomicrobiota bacterium]